MSRPIAVVAHTHPSISKGGAEIAAFALYEGLLAIGEAAIFIAVCPEQDRERLRLGSAREFAIFVDPTRYEHFYQLAPADVWRQLSAILQRQDVRLISFQHYLNLGANTLERLAAASGVPFVVTFHEFLAICNHHGQMVTRPGRRLCDMSSPEACTACYPEHARAQFAARTALIRDSLLHAAAFVSPSRFLADRMVAWGLPAERFAVIENGLRRVAGPAPAARARGKPWVFGYFGQLTPFKGGDILLDVIDIMSRQEGARHDGAPIQLRVHGTLVGQPQAFVQRFEQVFAQQGWARFLGPYDNADVATLMGACDYVLMPSTWWENSPVVIQEAFAAGRPVICTGIGGMAEKVPDRQAGLHFRRGDAADLARVMREAADDVLYAALVSQLPAVTDSAAMARSYLALFERMGLGRAQTVELAPPIPPGGKRKRAARSAA
jgi:glycosyltransferase involved in cell wall biosynthesis